MRGAGGGRPRKPDGERRNRMPSTHTTDVTVLPAAGRSGPAPVPIVRLRITGKQIWDALWSLPEATQWSPADVPAASRLVWLQQDPTNWADNKLLAEMRQLEDRLGLSPYARRAMHWVHEGEAQAEDGSRPAATVTRLKAVDGHAVAGP